MCFNKAPGSTKKVDNVSLQSLQSLKHCRKNASGQKALYLLHYWCGLIAVAAFGCWSFTCLHLTIVNAAKRPLSICQQRRCTSAFTPALRNPAEKHACLWQEKEKLKLEIPLSPAKARFIFCSASKLESDTISERNGVNLGVASDKSTWMTWRPGAAICRISELSEARMCIWASLLQHRNTGPHILHVRSIRRSMDIKPTYNKLPLTC